MYCQLLATSLATTFWVSFFNRTLAKRDLIFLTALIHSSVNLRLWYDQFNHLELMFKAQSLII